MTQALFLHIRTGRKSHTHVVSATGDLVRIGRGRECEVRLDDPAIADVECFLRRHGELWHLQPLSDKKRITIDGRLVTHLRAVALGVPIKVGDAQIILRDTATLAPEFGSVEFSSAADPIAMARAGSPLEDGARLGDRAYDDPLKARKNWDSLPSESPQPPPTRRTAAAEKLWEARWRAVGRSIRSQGPPNASGQRGATKPSGSRFTDNNRDEIRTFSIVSIEDPADDPHPTVVDTTASSPAHDAPTHISAIEDSTAIAKHLGVVSRSDSNIDETAFDASVDPAQLGRQNSQITPPLIQLAPIDSGVQLKIEKHHTSVPPQERVETNLSSTIESAVLEQLQILPSETQSTAQTPTLDVAAKFEVSPECSVHLAVPIASPDSIITTATQCTPCEPLEPSLPVEAEPLSQPDERSLTQPAPPRTRRDRLPAPDRRTIATPASTDEEWPSVAAILACHRPQPATSATPVRTKKRPAPTHSTQPKHWSPPGFLVFLTSAAAILLFGSLGVFLSFAWGRDDAEAGTLADVMFKSNEKIVETIAKTEVNPDGTWWKTTGAHLALRATALGVGRGDPAREESSRFLLDVARTATPLEPASRIARASAAASETPREVPLAALGLSRDAASLSLTARVLARSGRTQPALAAYRSALELAVISENERGMPATLFEEAGIKRFALPGEELVSGILREMAGQAGWTYATWSESLPNHGLVWLCAYRVLRDRGATEAESALSHLVESSDAASKGSLATHLAARAEGMSVRSRWQEAESLYAAAIASISEQSVRRTWHLNRAVILSKGGEKDKAEEAVSSARAGRGDDDIGSKVAQALDREGIGKSSVTAPRQIPGQSLRTN